uniref:Glomulin n=1 Tax=Biomphalaria glabrata TaxID=6526 RepID=A0A2C9KQ70_BIOGL
MWAPENAGLEPPIIEKIEDPEKLLAQIIECIQQRDSKSLKTYILEHKLKEDSIFWEMILNLGSCITTEMNENDPGFFDVCIRCLVYIIKVGNPKETLLALLEQIDNFIDDTKFKSFLPLVQTTILRMSAKLFHSLDITLGTVSSHIKSLPLPENVQLEGEEIKVFHMDKIVVRLVDNLQAYLDFLEPFVEKIDIGSLRSSESLVLKKHLISVFDQPLCYLILTYDPQKDKVKSDSRLCAEHAMRLLCRTETDFHRFIQNSKLQSKKAESRENSHLPPEADVTDICEVWDFKMNVSSLAAACLVYLIHVEHLGVEKLPFIYRHDYMLEHHLDMISLLIQNSNYPINFKGLLLCDRLVSLVQKNSYTAEHLDNPLFMSVLNDVINIMINCPVRDHRGLATKMYPLFISLFNEAGRYQIYMTVLLTNSHSGLKGYTITLLKNDIAEQVRKLKNKEAQSDVTEDYFAGKRLHKILKLAFVLQDKETTDMLEHSDQIISCLNLLRFLAIADPKVSNLTGFWDALLFIDKDFLSPLRLGLDLSKAHYQLELTNTMDEKNSDRNTNKDTDVSVVVGGMTLPSMNRHEKLELIGKALNTHEVMQSLLCRVSELIDQQQKT